MHRIVRGLESSCGLLLLTGEIGVGKTSLSRHIQGYLSDRYVFVELGNPYQTPLEQVFHCCEKQGIPTAGLSSIHDCVDRLEEHFRGLLEQGRRPAIIFEESHLLTKRHLGLIHILSNLRAQDGPLVQILVVGQLELLELLETQGMEALNQRIGVRCRLAPLTREDADKYIRFKLETGGVEGVSFSGRAVDRIWRQSGGVPRLINHICAHALDGLAFKGTDRVSADMIAEVCSDSVYSGLFAATRKKESAPGRKRWWISAAGLVAALFCAVLIWSMPEGVGERTAAAGVRQLVAPVPEVERIAALKAPVPLTAPAQEDVVLTVEEPAPAAEVVSSPETVDGDSHPVVGSLVLGAIAWNANPAKSIAVVDSRLLRTGQRIGAVRLVDIGRDFLVLEFEGELYRRSISR
ncbi:AAA family ATPase [Salidesulfovibrio onnuriiensis]|uniref:AAA family ATPase n=1 Tax=Salidesulfovibrio onnuriiensis TaxID=2583823 RepID=UPI0016504AB5|nr:AAA family ATPase [Salidesulfovibrio onnuriiensis]